MDKLEKSKFRLFEYASAKEWGLKNYQYWLKEAQCTDINIFAQAEQSGLAISELLSARVPTTPAGNFFYFYSRGSAHQFNGALRTDANIDEPLIDSDTFTTAEMIHAAINEMEANKIIEDIVTYRFVNKCVLGFMLECSGLRKLKKDAVVFDKAFLSTTLTLKGGRQGAFYKEKPAKIFKIYVPKGTPCVYIDLVSDMNENELLFPPKTKLRVLSVRPFNKLVECVVVT